MSVAIISGVTGQDGSLLAKFLLTKNYRVIGLIPFGRESDLFRLDYSGITEKIELKKVELLNTIELEQLLEETRPDEFYNLAAISSVGLSFQQPALTFDFNTRSVMNLLESIRKVSLQTRFYQASSSEMFGNIGRAKLPVKESFLFHPVSPYGISKASSHWLTVNYRDAYKLNACCGILFNHESALRPAQFVIKKVIRTAIDIGNGSEAKLLLGNINIARDWGYAPSYVEAMWRMLQKEKFDDFLICSGTPTYLKDFIFSVFAHLDLNATNYIVIDPSLMRSSELEIIYGDNSKAMRELKWEYEMGTSALIKRLIADEIELMNWFETNIKK